MNVFHCWIYVKITTTTNLLHSVCSLLTFRLAVVAMAHGRDLNDLSFAGLMGMWDPPREKVCVYTCSGTSLDTIGTEGKCPDL